MANDDALHKPVGDFAKNYSFINASYSRAYYRQYFSDAAPKSYCLSTLWFSLGALLLHWKRYLYHKATKKYL